MYIEVKLPPAWYAQLGKLMGVWVCVSCMDWTCNRWFAYVTLSSCLLQTSFLNVDFHHWTAFVALLSLDALFHATQNGENKPERKWIDKYKLYLLYRKYFLSNLTVKKKNRRIIFWRISEAKQTLERKFFLNPLDPWYFGAVRRKASRSHSPCIYTRFIINAENLRIGSGSYLKTNLVSLLLLLLSTSKVSTETTSSLKSLMLKKTQLISELSG